MCLGIPGRIVDIAGEGLARTGVVDFDGIRKEVSLAFLPEIEVGDYAIVHVGFAITRLDERSALETIRLLQQRDVLGEELDPAVALATDRARAGTTGP